MSAYKEFLEEKERLDGFIARDFKICGVEETLSGALVELEHPGGEKAEVHMFSADARKYMSNLIIKQLSSKVM